MKGFYITKRFTIEQKEKIEEQQKNNTSKVKITQTLLTLHDYIRFSDENQLGEICPGSFGTGIISQCSTNLMGIERGARVYIAPFKPCLECYNCKSGNYARCSNVKVASEDYDGFLRDFITIENNKLFPLPESVGKIESLYIGQISLAVSIMDKLNVEKGDYVSIVGSNNFAIILAQLLIYHQAVPILFTSNNEDYEIAKKSGIYYVFSEKDNWQKELNLTTGGRLTEKIVYIADSNTPCAKAFNLATYGAKIIYTNAHHKNNTISFTQAVKKELNIVCINDDFTNTETAINLIANKAVDLSNLKIDFAKFNDSPKVFEKMKEDFNNSDRIYETIVENKL